MCAYCALGLNASVPSRKKESPPILAYCAPNREKNNGQELKQVTPYRDLLLAARKWCSKGSTQWDERNKRDEINKTLVVNLHASEHLLPGDVSVNLVDEHQAEQDCNRLPTLDGLGVSRAQESGARDKERADKARMTPSVQKRKRIHSYPR